jgi:hypothetical protein
MLVSGGECTDETNKRSFDTVVEAMNRDDHGTRQTSSIARRIKAKAVHYSKPESRPGSGQATDASRGCPLLHLGVPAGPCY